MKKFMLFIVLFVTCVIACKKTPTVINDSKLVGSWHLYSFGSLLFPQTPADNIILTLQASGKYNQTSNSIVTEMGAYSLQHNNDSNYNTEINFFPDTSDSYTALMNIHDDTLILIPNVISTDGYFLAYSKQ